MLDPILKFDKGKLERVDMENSLVRQRGFRLGAMDSMSRSYVHQNNLLVVCTSGSCTLIIPEGNVMKDSKSTPKYAVHLMSNPSLRPSEQRCDPENYINKKTIYYVWVIHSR